MRAYLAALALSLATGLAASANGQEAIASAAQLDLTVTGPRQDLDRFVALQSARRPALATSAITFLNDGRAAIIVKIPTGYSNQELVQMTREARAAGLSYEYADALPAIRRKRA